MPWAGTLAVALIGGPLPAAAQPTLEGDYYGALGHLHLAESRDRHLTGYYGLGGPCDFDERRPLLDGKLEHGVFVGTVTTCQTGDACGDRTYPLLAILDVGERTFSGRVKLDPGCESPALPEGRFSMAPVRPGDGPSAIRPGDPLEPTPARGGRGRVDRQGCIRALQRGQGLLERKDYAGAAHYFAVGLTCNPDNWGAQLGRGIAELKRGRLELAMRHLEKARDLTAELLQRDPGVEAMIYYNLACGHARLGESRSALRSLSLAVERGFAEPQRLMSDPDLASLRDNPRFQKLVDAAWQRQGGAR